MKIAPDWFRQWFNSPYYYELYAERNDEEAAGLVAKLLDYFRPPAGSAMLDIACGRGRHARILARSGFDVTGIDIAPDSIAYARQFETERLHFFLHDMRLPCWINFFDYAFNFFTSFGYFKSMREHHAAVRTIADSLKKNGKFVLDYVNSIYAEAHLIPNSYKEINGNDYHIHRYCDQSHFYKQISIQDKNRNESLVFTEKIAKFTLNDFSALFAAHGLVLDKTFGDYDLNEFDEARSPRLLLIATKQR